MLVQIQYTPEEIARLGQAIYDRELRPRFESTHKGRFLVVDVISGDYEDRQ
jgi:hypothetical protein